MLDKLWLVFSFTSNPTLWFVIAGLASWRIASIIHHEKIAAPFRRLLGVRELTEDTWTYPDNFIGDLIECFYCTSVWTSFFVSVVMFVFPPVLVPFALSTVAIILEQNREK